MKGKNISIKKNFVMNAILTMSSFIFPLITFPYISRVLSPSGYGKINFANSVINYFAMFAQLGIPTYGVRAVAQVRDNKEQLTKTIHEIFLINAVTTLIAYIIFFISLFAVPKFAEDKLLFVIYGMTMLFNAIGMEYVYKGLEEYTYITKRSLFFKVISVAAMFMLVHKQSDYALYGAITVVSSSASSVFNLFHMRTYISFKYLGNYDLKKHLKPIFMFFAISAASLIYTNLDTVMLGFMKSDADVGYYNAAVKIKNILVSVVTSLGTVLLPRASYYVENGLLEEFKRISHKALHFTLIIAVPMAVYFMFFAREGILFLSGGAYEPSIMPMIIIMPTLILIGLTNIMGIQIMVPIGKEKYVLYSEIFGALVDLVLNALLIPSLASSGAAIGTLAAELVVWVAQYYYIREYSSALYKNLPYVSIIAAVILSSLGSVWIKMLHLNSFVTLVLSALLFFGIYAAFLIWRKDEMAIEIVQTLAKRLKRRRTA